MEEAVYVDGRMVPAADASVNVLDHALLYGDGIFEGIRAYSGRVFRLDQHIDRLFASAHALRLDLPGSRQEIAAAVLAACRHNEIVDAYIRLVVTRGTGDLGLDPRSCSRPRLIVIVKRGLAMHANRTRGITLITSALRRNAPDALSPQIKSLNYVNNVLARIEATDHGADDALMLDREGYVAEATAANAFIMTERGLATPPTATNLVGITRAAVMEVASSLAIRCEERRFTLFDVWTAREMFICGTGAELAPVVAVDGRRIGPGTVGPATQRIMTGFDRLVRSTGTPIYAGAGEPAAAAGSFRV